MRRSFLHFTQDRLRLLRLTGRVARTYLEGRGLSRPIALAVPGSPETSHPRRSGPPPSYLGHPLPWERAEDFERQRAGRRQAAAGAGELQKSPGVRRG
jgi:hypothetical protein